MNTFFVLCLLVLFAVSTALNCYQCSAFSGGCSDPFNATGSGVSQTGAISTNYYCKKLVAVGIATRSGETSCTVSGFFLSSGIACCQTDLCNGAHINYQMPIMLIVSLTVILLKMK